ncbi:MAG TPA: DMT family transporter [Acidimicrobiales bacterium]|nr:DMT family transporter [Acidimicrobiales bacterium]
MAPSLHRQDAAGGSPLGIAAAGTAVASWGMGNVMAKFIALSGPSLSFDRFWFGTAYAVGLAVAFRRRLSWRSLRVAAPAGVAFGANSILFFSAVKLTSITNASIIAALQPALVLCVVGRLFGERVRAGVVAATGLALAGTVAVVAGGRAAGGDNLGGDALAVLALVLWAGYFVAAKRARREMGTLEFQAALTIVAALTITPMALAYGAPLWSGWGTAGWVVLLAVGPGGGHFLMNWAHEHTSLTLASLSTLAIPVVAMAGAAVVLGERITAVQLAGTAVVLGSLAAVVVRGYQQPTRVARPSAASPWAGAAAVSAPNPRPAHGLPAALGLPTSSWTTAKGYDSSAPAGGDPTSESGARTVRVDPDSE